MLSDELKRLSQEKDRLRQVHTATRTVQGTRTTYSNCNACTGCNGFIDSWGSVVGSGSCDSPIAEEETYSYEEPELNKADYIRAVMQLLARASDEAKGRISSYNTLLAKRSEGSLLNKNTDSACLALIDKIFDEEIPELLKPSLSEKCCLVM